MFPYGEYLHETIKHASRCISCSPIKPKNIIHIKSDLVFCDECTDHIITDEELYGVPNYQLIYFSVYTYQVRCAKHGIITNGPNLCKLCEEIDDMKNSQNKRKTYRKKRHLKNMSCYIGEFNMVHYQPMLKNYDVIVLTS